MIGRRDGAPDGVVVALLVAVACGALFRGRVGEHEAGALGPHGHVVPLALVCLGWGSGHVFTGVSRNSNSAIVKDCLVH